MQMPIIPQVPVVDLAKEDGEESSDESMINPNEWDRLQEAIPGAIVRVVV